jgi:hypothetical protein
MPTSTLAGTRSPDQSLARTAPREHSPSDPQRVRSAPDRGPSDGSLALQLSDTQLDDVMRLCPIWMARRKRRSRDGLPVGGSNRRLSLMMVRAIRM